MSQLSGSFPITLTGNAGGVIDSALNGNFNLVGSGLITVTGTPATNTLTITDAGITGMTNHAVIVGNAGGSIASLATNGTTGQLLTGVTGADPTWTTATYPATTTLGDVLVASATNVVGVVNDVTHAGYVLTTNVGGAPSFQVLPASGIVTIDGNSGSITGTTVTIEGGSNITTTGLLTALTVAVSGTTQYALQVGNVSNSLSSLALGSSGQILQSGGVAANPAWSTATYPSTVALGDVLVASANNVVGVVNNVANAGYVLTANSAAAPTFQVLPTPVVGSFASDAETIAGTVNNKAVAPSNLKAKLGLQTLYGLPIGASDSAALSWTIAPTDGQLLIGSSVGTPSLATIGSGNNITVSNGHNTISVAVTGTTQHAVQLGGAAGQLASLTVGTTGKYLRAVSTADPVWSTLTLPDTVAIGDVLIATAANTVTAVTGASTSGYVLMANGAGTSPTFQAIPAAGVTSLAGLTGAITFTNGNNITITEALQAITVGVSGTTQYCLQVGNASNSLTSLAVGTAGYVLTSGGAGVNPGWTQYLPTTAGGTGVGTLTAHGVLLGEGTSSVAATAAGTAGQHLASGGAAADPVWTTATYPSTAAIGTVLIATAANTITAVSGATTAGYVLMANGAGTSPTFQANTSGSVTSVSGTTNQITVSPTTGATVVSLVASPTVTGTWTTTAGNLALPTTTATAGQLTIGGTDFAHAYGTQNTFVGISAGNFTTTGTGNNSGFGYLSLNGLSSGSQNSAYGSYCGNSITSGISNCLAGYGSATSLLTGVNNTIYGTFSGTSYVGAESNNIIIGANIAGVAAESNTLRIGAGTGTGASQINNTWISGVYTFGTALAAAAKLVLVDSANRIGGLVNGTSGYVLTSNGTTGTPGWTQYLPPTAGGTGVGTLTAHGVLLGEGTSSVSATSAGTAGQILVSGGASADPGWITTLPIANGGTNQTTFTTDGVVYFDGTHLNSTAVGTAGQVLTSNGTSVAPTFSTATYPSTAAIGTVLIATAANTITAVSGATTSGYVLTANGAGTSPTFQAPGASAVTSVSGTTNQITVSPTTGDCVVGLVASPTVTGTWTTSAGNLALPTTTSTAGQITINGSQWAHAYGTNNTFIGGAGNFTLTTANAISNVAIGSGALVALDGSAGDNKGNGNTAVGYNSAAAATNASYNSCYGSSSGDSLTTGYYNSFFGKNSGHASITTGAYNTFLGAITGGDYSSTESSNILIGYNVAGTNGENNQLIIGVGTGTGAGNINATYVAGITGNTSTSGVAVYCNSSNKLGTSTSSIRYKEDVKDMTDTSDIIAKLRPVTFKFKEDTLPKPLQYGLIAEEVEPIWPEMVIYGPDGLPQNLAYQFLAPVLLKEIQSLRKENKNLSDRITALESK